MSAQPPELQPVRGRARFGVDRGWVVLSVALVAILGLLLKPWAWSGEPTAIDAARPAESVEPVGEGLSPAPAAGLAGLPRSSEASWILLGDAGQPLEARHLRAVPQAAQLGRDCTGGVLIGASDEPIAMTLPAPSRPSRVSRVLVQRLFDGQAPLAVPATSTQDDVAGVALISPMLGTWTPGHYVVTIDIMGRTGMVAVCVGELSRRTDYSHVLRVPLGADSAAARESLAAQIRAHAP